MGCSPSGNTQTSYKTQSAIDVLAVGSGVSGDTRYRLLRRRSEGLIGSIETQVSEEIAAQRGTVDFDRVDVAAQGPLALDMRFGEHDVWFLMAMYADEASAGDIYVPDTGTAANGGYLKRPPETTILTNTAVTITASTGRLQATGIGSGVAVGDIIYMKDLNAATSAIERRPLLVLLRTDANDIYVTSDVALPNGSTGANTDVIRASQVIDGKTERYLTMERWLNTADAEADGEFAVFDNVVVDTLAISAQPKQPVQLTVNCRGKQENPTYKHPSAAAGTALTIKSAGPILGPVTGGGGLVITTAAITHPSGDWIDLGLAAGQSITITNAEDSGNNKDLVIVTITESTPASGTFDVLNFAASSLTANAGDTAMTIQPWPVYEDSHYSDQKASVIVATGFVALGDPADTDGTLTVNADNRFAARSFDATISNNVETINELFKFGAAANCPQTFAFQGSIRAIRSADSQLLRELNYNYGTGSLFMAIPDPDGNLFVVYAPRVRINAVDVPIPSNNQQVEAAINFGATIGTTYATGATLKLAWIPGA